MTAARHARRAPLRRPVIRTLAHTAALWLLPSGVIVYVVTQGGEPAVTPPEGAPLGPGRPPEPAEP